MFNELIKRHNSSIDIDGLKKQESNKLIEDWVRGIGSIKSKKGRPTTGRSVEVIMIRFTDYYQSDEKIKVSDGMNGNYRYITIEMSRKLFEKCIALS